MKASCREFSLPFGRGELTFTLPKGMTASVAASQPVAPLKRPVHAVASALRRPFGSPRLRELAKRDDSVAIVVTDNTRDCPDYLLVPALLEELAAAGVPNSRITIVAGIGMHRPMTEQELADKLGRDVCAKVRVVNPSPDDPTALAHLGTTSSGIPITVDRHVAEADLVVATGIVEPHQYAGYSGGHKTVAIGAGGEPTIRETHSPDMVDHPGTRLAKLDGNPFQEAITEAGRHAGLRFILNAVLDDSGRPVAVCAGDPHTAHRMLAETASRLYTVRVPHQYDVVVAGVGHPKDANLYQASRAASYMYYAPTPVVREGGAIIVAAPCPEGVGFGSGEAAFYRIMRSARGPQAIIQEAKVHGYPPGGQRAFVMARVLEWCTVYVAGASCPEAVAHCKMVPARTVEDALYDCAARMGANLRVLVVPHALQTLPIISPDQ
ncbi:MAG: nickel-dependent lactate racemase [Armatimonadota bacterium]